MSVFQRLANWADWLMSKPAKVIDTVAEQFDKSVESEALNRKVLHVLQGKLRHLSELEVWLSHNYDKNYWNAIFDSEQAKINQIRAWARELPDRQIRHSYLEWLDYYFEVGLRDARKELEYQGTRRSHEVYRKQQDQVHLATLTKEVPEPNL